MSKRKDAVLNDLDTLRKLKNITNIDDKLEENKTINENINLKGCIRRFINTLFTPRCYICNEYFENNNDSCVCDKCKEIYKKYEVRKIFFDSEEKEIGIGMYRYDGVIRFLIQKMKYEKNKKIAKALADIVENEFREFIKNKNVNYIVPIPIHYKRYNERGFNQSEVIAKVLSERLGIPIRTDILKRSRYTVPQSKLNFDERKDNVKNSFEILKKMKSRVKI